MLGRGVAAHLGPCRQRGDGADQHDVARACLQQRQAGAGAVERAVEVAAQGAFPGGGAGLGRAAQAMAAGTGQQHIETPVVPMDLPDEIVPGGRAGGVAHQDQTTGFTRHLFQGFAASADQHQLRTFLCVQPRTRRADAGTRAGDHHRARLSHGGIPCG